MQNSASMSSMVGSSPGVQPSEPGLEQAARAPSSHAHLHIWLQRCPLPLRLGSKQCSKAGSSLGGQHGQREPAQPRAACQQQRLAPQHLQVWYHALHQQGQPHKLLLEQPIYCAHQPCPLQTQAHRLGPSRSSSRRAPPRAVGTKAARAPAHTHTPLARCCSRRPGILPAPTPSAPATASSQSGGTPPPRLAGRWRQRQ